MSFQYHMDHVQRTSEHVTLRGWVLIQENPGKKIHWKVRKNNRPVSFELKETERPDVINALFSSQNINGKPGFEITIPLRKNESCEVILRSGFQTMKLSLSSEKIHQMIVQEENERIENEKAILKQHPEQKGISYDLWQRMHVFSDEEIRKEKERKWDEKAPLFSIVVPLYETPWDSLKEMVDSVVQQTYGKWELCLADGSQDDTRKEIASVDERIHYVHLSENRGISENTNAALKMAGGDYVVFVDHDDLLSINALYEMADAIEKNPDADYLYSDSDNTDETGDRYFNAYFKPDYDPDLLRSINYINHLSLIRKSFLDTIGYLRKEYDGAQDHDLVLRASEKTGHFVHVPQILYHWRASEGSTAAGMDEKSYAAKAGIRAVSDHWKRMYPEIQTEKTELNESNGSYHTVFKFDKEPLVSVITQDEDSFESVRKGNWQNLEHVRDVSEAKGEYLLFLENGVKMRNPDSLREMSGYGQRRDTGVIGAEIFAEDGSIVSAGILLGIHGSYANAFAGQNPKIMNTYFSRDSEVQNLMAVSEKAFMIRRDLFDEMHGLDETFEAEGKVIDLCLRCHQKGLWNVYDPYASFTGNMENPWKDQKKIVQKYPEIIRKGDPFANVNLSDERTDFTCRNPEREPMIQ